MSISSSSVRNIGFTSAARVLTTLLAGITSIVLARHLASSDYGVVAFAMIAINLFTQFNDFGINTAVIQRKELDDDALYTGFTIKVVLAVAAFLLAVTTAPVSRYLFTEHGVVDVIRLLALNFLLTSLTFLPITRLTRSLDFKRLALSQIASASAGTLISIALAVLGFKYWSIVIGNVGATLAYLLTLTVVKPVKMAFTFDRQIAVQYARFGAKLFLSQLLVFAIINTDNLIIGAVAGAETLGYYALAFNWGSLVSVVLASVILSVLFPTFTKMQDDPERIKEAYLKTVHIIAFLSIAVNLGMLCISKEFLVLVLGHGTGKWLPALPVFNIFCIYGILRALLEPVGSVFMALGQTGIFLKATFFTALVEVTLLYPALRYFGMTGVALLVTISYAVQYFIYFPALRKSIGLHFGEVVRIVWPSVVSGVAVAYVLNALLFDGGGSPGPAVFVLKLCLWFTCFFLLHGILSNWSVYKEARTMLAGLKAQKA